MGTTEANSRVKVLENIALQPSPSPQQCSCSAVRYEAALAAAATLGQILLLLGPKGNILDSTTTGLTLEASLSPGLA